MDHGTNMDLLTQYYREKRGYRVRIAEIEDIERALFAQELSLRVGTLRSKATKMKISAGYLCDVVKGRKNVTEDLVKKLDKLK